MASKLSYADKVSVEDSEDGKTIFYLENLSYKDWAYWIRDSFHDKFIIPLLDEEMSLPNYFFDIAVCIEPELRSRMYKGHADCIKGAYYGLFNKKQSKWTDKALDRLFLLAAKYKDLSDAGEFYQKIEDKCMKFLNITSPKPEFAFDLESDEPDIYSSVLACIVSAGKKMPLDFWLGCLGQGKLNYAYLCFWGADNNSPYDALSLLLEVPWESGNYAEDILMESIEHFIEKNMSNLNVLRAVYEQKKYLPQKTEQAIDEIFDDNQKNIVKANITRN
jgi:hypothetical protein